MSILHLYTTCWIYQEGMALMALYTGFFLVTFSLRNLEGQRAGLLTACYQLVGKKQTKKQSKQTNKKKLVDSQGQCSPLL